MAAKLCVSDCVADRVWFNAPQPTEWQRIGNQIDAAMIFARFHVVNVLWHVASSDYAWPNELQASCIQLSWQANCDDSLEEFNQHSRKPK
jgi:hypothetical protein